MEMYGLLRSSLVIREFILTKFQNYYNLVTNFAKRWNYYHLSIPYRQIDIL